MGRGLAVKRDHRPAILENFYLFRSEIDHRLDGDNQARLDLESLPALDVVQDRRILMKSPADTVAAEFPNDAEVVGFRETLHRSGNIRDVVSRNGGFDG